MPGLIRLREAIHNRILRLRSIETLISNPKFARLWDDSDMIDHTRIQIYIEDFDRDAIVKWIKEHPSIELAEKPIQELREIGRNLHIAGYSRMSKDRLILAIQEKEKEYGSEQNRFAL